MQVRCNVMFGLRHVEPENLTFEAARLLADLAEQIRQMDTLRPEDKVVLRDMNGNRVGVFDVWKDEQ